MGTVTGRCVPLVLGEDERSWRGRSHSEGEGAVEAPGCLKRCCPHPKWAVGKGCGAWHAKCFGIGNVVSWWRTLHGAAMGFLLENTPSNAPEVSDLAALSAILGFFFLQNWSHRVDFYLTGSVQELIHSKDQVLPPAAVQARAKPRDPEVGTLSRTGLAAGGKVG